MGGDVMQIQLNGKLLCTIDETQLSDVYQLLGKHPFTFHLNKTKGILDIVNPLQGCCIVLESKMTEVVDRLFYPVQSILSEVGLSVTIVESERARKQVLSRPNMQQEGIWITAMPDEVMEVNIHYFLHHMKQGKRLSQLLMMNIMKYADIPIRRANLNWRNYCYKISLLGHPWTMVTLAYGEFLYLSVEQLSLLSYAITRGMAFYFSPLPILDVVEQLREMEKAKRGPIGKVNVATCPDQLVAGDGEIISSPQNMKDKEQADLGEIGKPASTLNSTASCIMDDKPRVDDQEETNELFQPLTECIREPEENNISTDQVDVEQGDDAEQVELDQGREKGRVASVCSMFTWLQANTANKETSTMETTGEQQTSLLTFMNQKLLANQEREKKGRPSNFITMLREKKERDRPPTGKS